MSSLNVEGIFKSWYNIVKQNFDGSVKTERCYCIWMSWFSSWKKSYTLLVSFVLVLIIYVIGALTGIYGCVFSIEKKMGVISYLSLTLGQKVELISNLSLSSRRKEEFMSVYLSLSLRQKERLMSYLSLSFLHCSWFKPIVWPSSCKAVPWKMQPFNDRLTWWLLCK